MIIIYQQQYCTWIVRIACILYSAKIYLFLWQQISQSFNSHFTHLSLRMMKTQNQCCIWVWNDLWIKIITQFFIIHVIYVYQKIYWPSRVSIKKMRSRTSMEEIISLSRYNEGTGSWLVRYWKKKANVHPKQALQSLWTPEKRSRKGRPRETWRGKG